MSIIMANGILCMKIILQPRRDQAYPCLHHCAISPAGKVKTTTTDETGWIYDSLKPQLFCHQSESQHIQPVFKIDVIII